MRCPSCCMVLGEVHLLRLTRGEVHLLRLTRVGYPSCCMPGVSFLLYARVGIPAIYPSWYPAVCAVSLYPPSSVTPRVYGAGCVHHEVCHYGSFDPRVDQASVLLAGPGRTGGKRAGKHGRRFKACFSGVSHKCGKKW